ncbi:MAG: hypothetical protein RL536_145 [Candidatus Parcubacteria bacterium]|jgi:spore germination protein YaaH
MKIRYIALLAVLSSALFLNTSISHAQTTKTERLFYFTDTPSARASLAKNIDKIDIFAPQTYSINKSLIPYGRLNKEVKNIIGNHKIKVMPLITNDGFRQDIIHNLLASSTAQERVINFMIKEAKNNNYYGWQFDLEHISSTDRDLFTQFIKKTNDVFQKNDLALSIAVVVKVDESTTSDWYKNWSGVFDYKAISQNSDFISIMTYDDPDSKGPTASIPYVIKTLEYILEDGIEPQKISLGIPAYYWSWATYPKLKRIRSGSYSRLLTIKARTNYKENFSEELGVPWISFKEYGVTYEVWYENQKSFNLKTDLINKYGLRGFSMWVMGMEDPSIWKSL